MTNELSTERAIEALYTVRAYYASLTAGYPKGKDCRGIGDVMCSEIANSCLMAIKALEQTRWIPCSERLPKGKQEILISLAWDNDISEVRQGNIDDINCWKHYNHITSIAWMPLPEPYRGGESE